VSLVWAGLVVAAVMPVAITASCSFAVGPRGSYFEDEDRAAGVFGVLATGFAVLLGFVVFLALESFDTSRSGAEADAQIVREQFETAQLFPGAVRARLSGELVDAAVKDVNTLVAELTRLNGYLATTNSLMSNAISNSQQLSAKARAQLASLSTQLARVEANLGQARSLLGDQLSGKMRTKLSRSQDQVQSRAGTLAGQSAHLQQQGLLGVSRSVGAVGTRLGDTTSAGTHSASAIESQVRTLQAQVGTLEGVASVRDRAQGGRMGRGPAGRPPGGSSPSDAAAGCTPGSPSSIRTRCAISLRTPGRYASRSASSTSTRRLEATPHVVSSKEQDAGEPVTQ
jgi:hypothetical protein